MSAPGAKQQEASFIELLRAMEARMIERHTDLKREMQAMATTHGDLRQLGANLDYIFGADGTFTQTVKDVKRHNKYEIVTNAVGALVVLLLGNVVVQKIKKFIGVTQ